MAEANITKHVKEALKHYTKEAGRETIVAVGVGAVTAFAEKKGLMDLKLGGLDIPLDAVAGVLLLGGSGHLPHAHSLPLFGMSAGGALLAIGSHRAAGKFMGAKGAVKAAGDPDFGPGFGTEDPLLKAAAAL